MIRICYVVDAPFLGGAELYISRLISALDRGAFTTSVLMRRDVRDARLVEWADALRGRGTGVVSVPMRLPWVPADAWRIYRALDALAPHIVHVNVPGPYDGQFGLVLPIARATGARTVVTEHLPMVPPLWKRALVKRIGYRALDVAVTNAARDAEASGLADPVVLLSPACASFDQYRNFEIRGTKFRDLVTAMPGVKPVV